VAAAVLRPQMQAAVSVQARRSLMMTRASALTQRSRMREKNAAADAAGQRVCGWLEAQQVADAIDCFGSSRRPRRTEQVSIGCCRAGLPAGMPRSSLTTKNVFTSSGGLNTRCLYAATCFHAASARLHLHCRS